MEFIKEKLEKFISILFFIFLPTALIYADAHTCESGRFCNPISGANTIHEFIQVFLDGALTIGIPIVALAIIYSGFLFVAARGNPEKLETAKQTLLYTIIGAAILLGSWAIAQLISNTVLAL